MKIEPPDDPDENSEFEEWVYFEDGKMVTTQRKNPNYKPPVQPQIAEVSEPLALPSQEQYRQGKLF